MILKMPSVTISSETGCLAKLICLGFCAFHFQMHFPFLHFHIEFAHRDFIDLAMTENNALTGTTPSQMGHLTDLIGLELGALCGPPPLLLFSHLIHFQCDSSLVMQSEPCQPNLVS